MKRLLSRFSRRKDAPLPARQCETCGAQFVPLWANQHLCNDCYWGAVGKQLNRRLNSK